jgi:hypothetical protein
MASGQRAAHADVLAALTGEDESEVVQRCDGSSRPGPTTRIVCTDARFW